MRPSTGCRQYTTLFLLSILPASAFAGDILSTNGFSLCSTSPSIEVNKLDATYDRSTRQITFDVAGSSTQSQNVTLDLTVTAYGKEVYTKDFDPCDLNMDEMCPGKSDRYLLHDDLLTVIL